jgi:hypothetical protein
MLLSEKELHWLTNQLLNLQINTYRLLMGKTNRLVAKYVSELVTFVKQLLLCALPAQLTLSMLQLFHLLWGCPSLSWVGTSRYAMLRTLNMITHVNDSEDAIHFSTHQKRYLLQRNVSKILA